MKIKKNSVLLTLLVSSSFVLYGQLPDLVVTNISWEPDPVKAGMAVSFSATIENAGEGPTPEGVIVGVKFQADGTTFGWNDLHTTSVQPGESINLTVSFGPDADLAGLWVPENPGAYTISAEVDDYCMSDAAQGESSYCTSLDDPACKNRICESNEENNKLFTEVNVTGEFKYEKMADLIITDFSWTPENPKPGDDVVFNVTISNIGDTVSQSTNGLISVVFYLDGTKIVRTKTTNDATDLERGQTASLTTNHSYDASGGTEGSWIAVQGTNIITAEVDDKANIEEHVESNNQFSKTLYIDVNESAKQADLIVTDIIFEPDHPSPGEMISLKATVKNIGAKPTEPEEGKEEQMRVAFYVNEGRISRTIGAEIVKNPVSPDETITVTGNFRDLPEWKFVDGKYSSNNPASIIIKAEADHESRIKESNNDNNTHSEQIVFFPLTEKDSAEMPDLIIDKVFWSTVNDSLQFSADILNEGNAPTPSIKTFKVFFEVFDTIVVGHYEGSVKAGNTIKVSAPVLFDAPSEMTGNVIVTVDVIGKWFEIVESDKRNNRITYDLSTGEINSIDVTPVDLNFNIYPNPVKENLFIQCNRYSHPSEITIKIFDMTGILYHESKHSSNETIKINTLNYEQGIYIVQLHHNSCKYYKRIIVHP